MPSPRPSSSPLLKPGDLGQQASDLAAAGAGWLQSHWLQILLASAAGAGIVILLQLARRLGARLCAHDRSGTGWSTVIGRAISETNLFFMVMLAARLVAGYAGAPVEVAETIAFLFTVAAVFQCAIWARELILGAVEHRAGDEHAALTTAMGLIRVLVTVALFAIALVVVLDNLGVNVTGLIAGLGVGGIAIGLAAQGIFADLFAALAIIFDRPFRRGDAITYDKSSGTVEAIGLKSTRIRGATGEERIISNKNLLDREIQNNTRREYRRIIFTLGLVQTTPVAVMQRLPHTLKEIVEAAGGHYVRAGFITFGASSYDFELQFDSPGSAFQDAYDLRHAVAMGIIDRFNADGIALAYPTQTTVNANEAGLSVPDPASLSPDPSGPPGASLIQPHHRSSRAKSRDKGRALRAAPRLRSARTELE